MGITDYPKCANKACNNIITSNIYRLGVGYNSYGKYNGMTKCCSISCLNQCDDHKKECENTYNKHKNEDENFLSNISKKAKQTKKTLYGDENYCNVEKIMETKKRLHGDPNYNNIEQGKKTRFIHNGEGIYHSTETIEKMKATSMSNNGVEWSLSSKIVRDKGKNTKLLKYGDENYSNREKFFKTLKERYGKERCPQYVYLYNEIYFDSGSELCFYIYCIDHGLNIKQSNLRLEYVTHDGKIRHYFPDFEIDDKIIEIKGDHLLNENNELINPYVNNKIDIEKTKCMRNNNVIIIRYSELKEMYDYVDSKYGKNFIKQHRLKKV